MTSLVLDRRDLDFIAYLFSGCHQDNHTYNIQRDLLVDYFNRSSLEDHSQVGDPHHRDIYVPARTRANLPISQRFAECLISSQLTSSDFQIFSSLVLSCINHVNRELRQDVLSGSQGHTPFPDQICIAENMRELSRVSESNPCGMVPLESAREQNFEVHWPPDYLFVSEIQNVPRSVCQSIDAEFNRAVQHETPYTPVTLLPQFQTTQTEHQNADLFLHRIQELDTLPSTNAWRQYINPLVSFYESRIRGSLNYVAQVENGRAINRENSTHSLDRTEAERIRLREGIPGDRASINFARWQTAFRSSLLPYVIDIFGNGARHNYTLLDYGFETNHLTRENLVNIGAMISGGWNLNTGSVVGFLGLSASLRISDHFALRVIPRVGLDFPEVGRSGLRWGGVLWGGSIDLVSRGETSACTPLFTSVLGIVVFPHVVDRCISAPHEVRHIPTSSMAAGLTFFRSADNPDPVLMLSLNVTASTQSDWGLPFDIVSTIAGLVYPVSRR